MRPDFNFYIKASSRAFKIEPSQIQTLVASYESPNFVCFSNEPGSIRLEYSTESEELQIEFGYPSIGFAKIRWSERSKRLVVELDELGLQSFFFAEDEQTVRLANRVEILERAIAAPRLSEKSINFFLVAGFLPPGWNFIENMRRVDRRSEWLLEKNLNINQQADWLRYSFESPPNVSEMIETIRHALHKIEDEVKPNEIRLSGGADTRIVSALYPRALPARVVHSPWMAEGDDMDVNLARAWARENGHQFDVIHTPEDRFHFFVGDSDRPVLTGLAGGEFLGGQYTRVIPSAPDVWMHRAKRMLSRSAFEELESDSWIRRVVADSHEWRVECARVLLQSTRSTIYQSTHGSWTSPYSLTTRVVSPFTIPVFIKRFLSMSDELLGDYEFYEQVFEAIGPRLKRVPLCSQLALRRPELSAGQEWGRNPKTVQSSRGGGLSLAEVLEELALIFEKMGCGPRRHEISELASGFENRLPLRSVHAWLKPRYLSAF